jgi:vancomycin permeability regulator SanA
MTRRKKHGWLKTMLGLMLGCMLVVVAVFAATNVATIATTKDRIVEPQAAVGFDADAIVVLGASVFADGTPSGILRDRLDDGIALYKEGVAPKLIMSGDNSTVSYNEVQVMKDYAISQGVPSYDIFCDHAGFSTYESMYRAKHVFGAERIVVATRGSRGSMAYDGQRFYGQGIVPCRVVDTMGAGDSFIAGFLHSWLEGLDIPGCMAAGAQCSAVTLGYEGAW